MHRRLSLKLKKSSGPNTEKLIKESTQNDTWGPTGTELNQLSILSHNTNDLNVITKVLMKRLKNSNKLKDWRSILKSLTIIQFMLQVGSLEFVEWCRSIKSLLLVIKDYQLVISNNPEVIKQMSNINHKSVSILEMLDDNDLLEKKRVDFHILRSEMSIPGFHDSKRHELKSDKIDVEQSLNFKIPERSVKSLEINRSQLFGSLNVIDSSSDEEDNGNNNNNHHHHSRVSSPQSMHHIPFSSSPNKNPSSPLNSNRNGGLSPRLTTKLSRSNSGILTTLLEEEEEDNRVSSKLRRSLAVNSQRKGLQQVANTTNTTTTATTNNDHLLNTQLMRSLSLNTKKSPLPSLSINTNLQMTNDQTQSNGTTATTVSTTSPLSLPIMKTASDSISTINMGESPSNSSYIIQGPGSPSTYLPDSNPFKHLVEEDERAEAQKRGWI